MHRVRTSLPYFKKFGWQAEVVAVEPAYSDMGRDDLLLKSIPADIKIHYIKAFDKKWTSKLGLGSIALRSLWFCRQKVDELLKNNHYDLILFSTTQFPVCILGAYWKRKFKVPYVIDMQDPWHSDYYRDKPKNERPAKYWFSYRLNKYLEPVAIKNTAGLISVSEQYLVEIKSRYPEIKNLPTATITFGAFEPDIEITIQSKHNFRNLLDPAYINIVYVGRGGIDMHKAIAPVFESVSYGLSVAPVIFSRLKFHFVGTSYAPDGFGKPTILPLARMYNMENQVIEITDRIPYYHALATLLTANALFIPGSDNASYSASKIYPYLLTCKPVLALFNAKSPMLQIMNEFGIQHAFNYDNVTEEDINRFFFRLVSGRLPQLPLPADALRKHSAITKTQMQCKFYDEVLMHGKT